MFLLIYNAWALESTLFLRGYMIKCRPSKIAEAEPRVGY